MFRVLPKLVELYIPNLLYIKMQSSLCLVEIHGYLCVVSLLKQGFMLKKLRVQWLCNVNFVGTCNLISLVFSHVKPINSCLGKMKKREEIV